MAACDPWLGAALANMPYGLSIWDQDLRLVAFNENYLAMFHLPREQVRVGMTLRDLAEITEAVDHGELDAEEIFALYRARFGEDQDGRIIEHEVRERSVRSRLTRMSGQGWMVTHQDITEEVEARRLAAAREQALAQQNMRFDAAINNMLHGLSMFDGDNRLIVCNRQYAEMYRLPPDLTRPGTSFWDILDEREKSGMVPVADRPARLSELRALIDAAQPFKHDRQMLNGHVISIMHQPMPGGGWVSTHEDVTEQHLHQEAIRHLARHDALTDLPNRVLFHEKMANIGSRPGYQGRAAVLWIDLDHFKSVNDTLGHSVGDGVLVAVARRLREAAREADVVARLGGDEFAVLITPLEDPRHAALIADRIVHSIAQPISIGDRQVVIGASIGIALAPTDGTDAETLLKSADLALYRAKGEGRGSYRFFEKGMDEALKQRRALELALRLGLEEGQFRLVYQPLISLGDNKVCCLEALLRWDHPELGPIAPSEFVPIAEESGAIVAIGEWVLEQACKAASLWPDTIRVAVNLSPAQFRHGGLVDSIERALASAGLAPDRLELEINESVLAIDTDTTFRILHRLRAIGVRISMDDFGTGYASLGYLRRFPFDKVKIDRSLMDSRDGDAMALLNAMIGVGQSLGMATAAEGIETEEQLESVRHHGCNEVQGFLFSPPLPASGVDALFGALGADGRRKAGVAG